MCIVYSLVVPSSLLQMSLKLKPTISEVNSRGGKNIFLSGTVDTESKIFGKLKLFTEERLITFSSNSANIIYQEFIMLCLTLSLA